MFPLFSQVSASFTKQRGHFAVDVDVLSIREYLNQRADSSKRKGKGMFIRPSNKVQRAIRKRQRSNKLIGAIDKNNRIHITLEGSIRIIRS